MGEKQEFLNGEVMSVSTAVVKILATLETEAFTLTHKEYVELLESLKEDIDFRLTAAKEVDA